MDKKQQGKLLRAWRHHMSAERNVRITLTALAADVAARAEAKGFAPESRKIPGTHASMTRWELGDSPQSLDGLQIIAEVYGVSILDLMKPPPTPQQIEDEKAVEEYRRFIAERHRS